MKFLRYLLCFSAAGSAALYQQTDESQMSSRRNVQSQRQTAHSSQGSTLSVREELRESFNTHTSINGRQSQTTLQSEYASNRLGHHLDTKRNQVVRKSVGFDDNVRLPRLQRRGNCIGSLCGSSYKKNLYKLDEPYGPAPASSPLESFVAPSPFAMVGPNRKATEAKLRSLSRSARSRPAFTTSTSGMESSSSLGAASSTHGSSKQNQDLPLTSSGNARQLESQLGGFADLRVSARKSDGRQREKPAKQEEPLKSPRIPSGQGRASIELEEIPKGKSRSSSRQSTGEGPGTSKSKGSQKPSGSDGNAETPKSKQASDRSSSSEREGSSSVEPNPRQARIAKALANVHLGSAAPFTPGAQRDTAGSSSRSRPSAQRRKSPKTKAQSEAEKVHKPKSGKALELSPEEAKRFKGEGGDRKSTKRKVQFVAEPGSEHEGKKKNTAEAGKTAATSNKSADRSNKKNGGNGSSGSGSDSKRSSRSNSPARVTMGERSKST